MDLGGTENVILQLCEIFKPHVNKIVVCSKAGVNVEKLNDMGIEHYDIDDIASKNPVLMLKNYIKIKKIVKYEKITVIILSFILKKSTRLFFTISPTAISCVFLYEILVKNFLS